MRILSKMLSKKNEPGVAESLDAEDGFDRLIDDSGRLNSSGHIPEDIDLSKPLHAKPEEPEQAGSGLEQTEWDDDAWDDDESWGDDEDAEFDIEDHRVTSDRQLLVTEIRDAMVSVSRFEASDDPSEEPQDLDAEPVFSAPAPRRRSRLTEANEASEDRILEKTEDVMSDRETSRRRSAMAHMKAAAAATKADRVLQHVAARDPSADPEEQSPYRDDLAKVVKPHTTSRPISRVVTRPRTASPIWDQGEGDEDAALFAAAEDGFEDDPSHDVTEELAAAEEERLRRSSEARFLEDEPAFSDELDADLDGADYDYEAEADADEDMDADEELAFDDHATAEEDFEDHYAFDDDEDDDGFDLDAEDDFAPRPSSMVSEAIAFAKGETDGFTDDEEELGPRNIWDVAEQVASEVDPARSVTDTAQQAANLATMKATVAGRSGRSASAGRVKTRLLGFQADEQVPADVFANSQPQAADATAPLEDAEPAGFAVFPAGWIVVVDGPGRGSSFALLNGVSQIGRGPGQTVRLDFGDTSISRNNHAAVAYDDEQGKYFLGHGGKSNLVRLNGMPVLSTEELTDRDEIRIGETTMVFVALCGDAFTWSGTGDIVADE